MFFIKKNTNLSDIFPVQINISQCKGIRLEKDREYKKKIRLEQSLGPYKQVELEKVKVPEKETLTRN